MSNVKVVRTLSLRSLLVMVQRGCLTLVNACVEGNTLMGPAGSLVINIVRKGH